MPDDAAAARERIERRGIPLALRAPALRAVASAWLGGFVGLLLPPWLRRLFHRPMPVGWQRVTFYVARRAVAGVALFAAADRFFRGWARIAREADELRERMRSELDREPTDEEFWRAFAKQRGYDWPG